MPNRWVIATAGVVMQVALGAVYAWSVFRIPLTKAFGWTIPQVTLTFTIAIFGTGVRGVCRGPLDAARRPTGRGGRGGDSVRARRVPRELHGRPALVALSFLRAAGRDRSRARLHRSGRHPREMVSGSSRHDHGHRRYRIRNGRAGGGTNRDATHRASRSAADVLDLRHRVSAGRHRRRTLHAESACGISSRGLGASGQPAAGREIGDAVRGRRRAGSGTDSGRCCS